MSIVRPLASRLSRAAPMLARASSTLTPGEPPAASSSTPTPSFSSLASSEDIGATASSSSRADPGHGASYITQWIDMPNFDVSLYPSIDVPRKDNYPTRFLDSPKHQHFNHPSPLWEEVGEQDRPEILGQDQKAKNNRVLSALTGLSGSDIRKLNRYTVATKRVVNMTKKGKMPSWYALVVAGSPERGLVGIGRGRSEDIGLATDKGFHRAVLSMDYVNKFENRTLWGQGADLTAKWGATTVTMRARPPGFGLQVPHVLHRLFTACGIRDASAAIEGSRNEMQVLNCALQIIHGGFGPPGLGSGTGNAGRRQDKGAGMRSIQDLERERGRYGVDISRRV